MRQYQTSHSGTKSIKNLQCLGYLRFNLSSQANRNLYIHLLGLLILCYDQWNIIENQEDNMYDIQSLNNVEPDRI